MEISESNKVSSQLVDVRQSPMWGEYLKVIGWKSYRTSNDINIEFRKLFFGSFVKIQKPKPLSKSDLDEIESICRKNHAMFIKIEPYLGQDTEILQNAGYDFSLLPMTPTSTFFINLDKTEEELWDGVSHSGKYSVNRAKREGANVKVFRHPKRPELEELYKVLRYTGKVQKLYIPPMKQILSQVEAFGDNGHLFIVYDKAGNLCGAKWYVTYGGMVLYVSGGTSEIGRKDKSGYLLLWESILYFKSLGLKVLDLEGKDDERFPNFTKRWGGFTHFKEKFGGEVIVFPYPHIKYLNPVFKFMNSYMGFQV